MNDIAPISLDLAVGSTTDHAEFSNVLASTTVAEPISRAARCSQSDSIRLAGGGFVLPRLDASRLVAALDQVFRRSELVAAVLVERSLSVVQPSGVRALDLARRAPYGVCVDAPPSALQATPMAVAIRLAAAVTRRRSAAMWEAIDALAATGGNAEAAAALLGCSGQAVRERRIRANLRATADLHLLIARLASLRVDDTPGRLN